MYVGGSPATSLARAGDAYGDTSVREPGSASVPRYHAQLVSAAPDKVTQAKTMLTAQAAWLRQHPEVSVRIEGYGDPTDTRDHALAVGARRAEETRDQLVLLGVPSAQVSTTSWGKERPGLGRAVTVLVR